MWKKVLLITGAAVALAGCAILPVHAADTAGQTDSNRQQLIEVKVCPITGDVVHGHGAGNEVVDQYKVYFCCGGCQSDFDKLSAEQKLQKAEAAYKIQLASTAAPNTAGADASPQQLIDVKVCPIMKSAVHGDGIGSEVVGKYKVYFCCKGCPEAFDKLTPEQKLQKAEEAYAIQQHNAAKNAH
jgi:hypothetical protein